MHFAASVHFVVVRKLFFEITLFNPLFASYLFAKILSAQLLLDRATFACEGDELQTHLKTASHALYKWKIIRKKLDSYQISSKMIYHVTNISSVHSFDLMHTRHANQIPILFVLDFRFTIY